MSGTEEMVPESIADVLSACNIQWGPIFWVAILHYLFCSALCGCLSGEESECPRKRFTQYSLCEQRHEMLDLFEETLLSRSLQPTLERRF